MKYIIINSVVWILEGEKTTSSQMLVLIHDNKKDLLKNQNIFFLQTNIAASN